jgi:hypothetical protein
VLSKSSNRMAEIRNYAHCPVALTSLRILDRSLIVRPCRRIENMTTPNLESAREPGQERCCRD